MKKEIKNIESITNIDERDMTRSVIARADEAIAELETRLSEANQRMVNAVQEAKSIPEDRTRRIAAFNQAKEAAMHLRDKLGHAQALSRLYTDTPMARAYQDDVDALQAELKSAESLLRETESAVNERGFSSNEREKELENLIEFKLKPEIVQLQTELRHMQDGRMQAKRELATQEYAATMREYQEHNRRVEEAEEAVFSVKEDRSAFIRTSIGKFREYRDLNEKIKQELPLDDHNTIVLEAHIRCIELLLKHRTFLSRKLPVRAASNYTDWTESLVWYPGDFFYSDLRGNGPPKRFHERVDHLTQLLADYRTYLAENT